MKKRCWLIAAALLLGGCSTNFTSSLEKPSHDHQEVLFEEHYTLAPYAAEEKIIGDNSDYDVSGLGCAAALFMSLDSGEVYVAYNAFHAINLGMMGRFIEADYALTHSDQNIQVVLNESIHEVDQARQTLGLLPSDLVYLSDLIYGGTIFGACDAFIPAGQMISGTTSNYIQTINTYLESLNMTRTRLLNVTGIVDTKANITDQQKTTIYDLYLYLRTTRDHDDLWKILSAAKYVCNYYNSDGVAQTKNFVNYIPYFFQTKPTFSGLTIVGGMTDSNQTGFCAGDLLILAKSPVSGERMIGLVCGASSYEAAYQEMEKLLAKGPAQG